MKFAAPLRSRRTLDWKGIGRAHSLVVWLPTAMIIIRLTAILLCLAVHCHASHEGAVDPQSVVMSYRDLGVEIAVEKDNTGNLTALKVTRDGKAYSVPAAEFTGIGKGFLLGQTRVLVSLADGGSGVRHSTFDHFTISIPYGETTVNMEGDREIHSHDEVRFEFADGRFHLRRRSVSVGDDANLWKLFFKNAGEPEQEGGEHKGPMNVYAAGYGG